ncbi:hypothetical protein SLEP1_g21755 [Rubroshorea leprosula]|uniref:Uncharacterized protein n=1 Tax=Rubroshorea leprosula TaxID=152421 RepID=A0AAV5JHT0_9ROSI|nr:hypothetical protein SLEP1_g21755 [Rubroshorea leprosula]
MFCCPNRGLQQQRRNWVLHRRFPSRWRRLGLLQLDQQLHHHPVVRHRRHHPLVLHRHYHTHKNPA